MEDQTGKGDGLADHVEGLIETSLRLVFVNATQKTVNFGAGVLNTFLIYVLGIFVLLFASAGLAWWLGDLLHNRVAGFLLVAGLYCLVLFLILLFRKKIIYPFIRNSLVRKVYE